MELLRVLSLAFCCGVVLADVLNVNKSKGWVKNNSPYEIVPGLQAGDELSVKLMGNSFYYMSFTNRVQGHTILEIRFGQSNTYIQHVSNCEGFGPNFKVFQESVTTGGFQSLKMKLKQDGLTFSLDGGPEQVLRLEGCNFPWQTARFVEFTGNCKKTYGNWRGLRVDRD